MSLLDEILNIKFEETKRKSYKELSLQINNVECFKTTHTGKRFQFEIHVNKEGQMLKVMVECSRDLFFLDMFGQHKYFSINENGDVADLTGSDFWG